MGPGERLNGIQEVSGSIPLISTTKVPKSHDFGTFSLYFLDLDGGIAQSPAKIAGGLTIPLMVRKRGAT